MIADYYVNFLSTYMTKKTGLKVLDCTFRDGGYYNSWVFPERTVANYIKSVESAGIDFIEIGFRSVPQNQFLGPYCYSTDQFISSLNLPANLKIGVMINAKEYLDLGAEKSVHALFAPAHNSPVKLVRIAAHLKDVELCADLSSALKTLGYTVGFNIMQVGGKTPQEISTAAKLVKSWGTVDVLYFADSIGNMTASEVKSVVSSFKEAWQGEIGVHCHDNMGLALANTIAAYEAGATWLDGTMLGMGRGAGNTRTEHLLIELRKLGYEYNPESLFSLVLEDFEQLKAKYGWGQNLLYYLSASYGVHPTYIQEMLGDKRYAPHQVINAFETICSLGNQASYNPTRLQKALVGERDLVDGSWSASNLAKDQDILIVGPGPSVKEHLSALKSFIQNNKPYVICLNTYSALGAEFVDAYAACHHSRILMESDRYSQLRRPLIIPTGFLPNIVKEGLKGIQVYDYGIQVKDGQMQARPTSCTIPALLVAGYVLSVAQASSAKKILLAGFDGYGSGDPRQAEMLNVIEAYQKLDQRKELLAITPTTYPVPQFSVYAPNVNL